MPDIRVEGGDRFIVSDGRFRTFAWVGVIALVAGLAAYFARPAGRTATDVRRSSFRTTPDGVAAFARGLERFGRPTAPRLTPLADADPVPGTLVLLSPAVVPSPVEVHALLERVRRGGTLVYAPQLFPAISSALRITPLMDSLGIAFRVPRPGDLEGAEWAAHSLTDGLPAPSAPRRALRRMTSRELGEDTRSVPPLQTLLTVGSDEDRRLTGAALMPFGDGHIVVLSDAEPLSNGRVADDPLALVVMRAVLTHTTPADTIFFAEFHQGIRGYESTARRWAGFVFGSAEGRTLLQLLLAAFLALACAGLRFGAPTTAVAPPDLERRSPLEHVSALGDLYEKARARQTAALLLLARLARGARRPPPRDVAEARALIRELEARRGEQSALARIRRGLRADPVDLTMVAAGIDDHLGRRAEP
ncbi:MAG: DUF4350 domain-containing protein [Gemmatimonadota bacterium]|uniref:DUF4350 domain-containing protein n=1 Tax=Candidatus Palauibacter scopulicola TaxID=3056741 RepID=UPI002388D313|nr:DUF4350 domain-containing protein [Candidatus Palauibacter scopulicola]MDE2662161.1 DUF4350 domain-containing protein [Candidatus Palauibacter scopulicola]